MNKFKNLNHAFDIVIGNKVRVKPHKVTSLLSGFVSESSLSNKTGFVVEFFSKYEWESVPSHAMVRLYFDLDEQTGLYREALACSVLLSNLEVIESCEGMVEAGKTCPYSQSELRDLQIKDQLAKIEKHDFKVQGYSNMATHLAALYLDQDKHFQNQLERLRRKDGTLDPNKVADCFKKLNLAIEQEAFEPPGIFGNGPLSYLVQQALRARLQVNWKEVADDFLATA